MVTRTDYTLEAVKASRSVLLELTRMLGAYRDYMVLVGGSVPSLLLPKARPSHVGTLDIDLALDHRRLPECSYETIRDLLIGRNYDQDKTNPFTYRRNVLQSGREITVQVDLMAGEYQGTGRRHRTQTVQDIRLRKARGCDLAFDMFETIELEAELPGGGNDKAKIRVASMVPFFVMKGMALEDRLKEKDAYDIFFCVKNYAGGPEMLAAKFRPHIENALVMEGLRKIASKFLSPEEFGPTAVASFQEVSEPEERALVRRDAYEQVSALLRLLGVEVPD